MSLRTLPKIKLNKNPSCANFVEKWDKSIRAEKTNEHLISILDEIGKCPWTGQGVTASEITTQLEKIKGQDVVVDINSPGGDFFEGVAIYNLLRKHTGKVTVRVIGLAASAASVIAMAGDEILMGTGSFLMVHNSATFAYGNKADLSEIVNNLEKVDVAMADLYAAKTGLSKSECKKMMDVTTWIAGAEAVNIGFADDLLPDSIISKNGSGKDNPLAILDAALQQYDPMLTSAERQNIMCAGKKDFTSITDEEIENALSDLNKIIKAKI